MLDGPFAAGGRPGMDKGISDKCMGRTWSLTAFAPTMQIGARFPGGGALRHTLSKYTHRAFIWQVHYGTDLRISDRPTVAATARRPPSFVRCQSRGGGGGGGGGGQEMRMGPSERANALRKLPRAGAIGGAMREGWATLLGIAVHLRRFLANVLLVLSLGSGFRV
jgi:hypothetical protein